MHTNNNIVLIHGLWMTSHSFESWIRHYRERDVAVHAPAWPGMDRDVAALRDSTGSYANLRFRSLVDHFEQFVLDLDTPPILMGHGVGGLIVQSLLDRGLGACGVGLASAPINGVWKLPGSTMRAISPRLMRRRTFGCLTLTPAHFRRAFTNTASEQESLRLYENYAVPAPKRVLFQAEFANFIPFAETSVNTRRNNRAPLLLVAAGEDRLVPPAVVKANVHAYRYSRAVTAYREFPGRSHLLIAQEGWREVADYALDWACEQERLVEENRRQQLARAHPHDSRRVA